MSAQTIGGKADNRTGGNKAGRSKSDKKTTKADTTQTCATSASIPSLDQKTVLEDLVRKQGEAFQALFSPFLPTAQTPPPDPADIQHWAMSAAKLQKMWLDFGAEQAGKVEPMLARMGDPSRWSAWSGEWLEKFPLARPETQKALWQEGVDLWASVLGAYAKAPAGSPAPDLPRRDRRFSDPKWREQPVFALIHQTYLLLTERLGAMVDDVGGLPEEQHELLRFLTRVVTDSLSPANFPMTNPMVIERTLETHGENLVRGVEHLLNDLRRGQLTHTRSDAFELGRNIAATPGKVVHETPLFQLIQYTPTTETVAETPLVIFPPWINRFYILDLNPGNSFIRWAVEQGLSVFVVSWKSADASMADIAWDDYVKAQIEAIELVRARLSVEKVHTIGYCVAGTTLAATLALLARRGLADRVASATFFTAQVDFEKAGDLKHFIEDPLIRMFESLTTDGYLDGRYMAATFNLLRPSDLIWNYVVNNYLLGQDYPAFDLLYWNGDTTNLPFGWLKAYLIDLYRDNRLVVPDDLMIDGTPIDLHRIKTPCYIQAGRLDHIAPAESVWKLTRHLSGPWKFVLAGSGHIAGVVNPPQSGKYQYWLNANDPHSLDEFIAGSVETKGSWWPDWIEWIRSQGDTQVPAGGLRTPGGKGDPAIEDAPGRYVKQH
ncbi:Poly(R)-hydroxyalkanoic acid synthase, class I [Novosphingobium nitrogenifigens DSM 19370]|uniref:Poly(R)-hydroxyalkanoic acid synthase, class I n=1 Tax=Novosphingobium nitrogenifigens DSM 19370 TaxID=983920 RepID=F1ZC99_9SPHN|nr:class I poly(R)-hydroxyalkanoic acid synthase [Novosphingobium nitrogenifigens]EGD57694.1 Poly(R)-hydroxyalkanoic acid synthase, class I [Novosphingobium nitrogenifigens DSM 19370]